MATTLQHLARWALQLQKDQIPSDVLDLAKMQHLAVAGAVRGLGDSALASQLLAAGPRRPPRGPPLSSGAPLLIGGHTSNAAHALRVHAALASALDFDEYMAFGQPGPGAVCATWMPSEGDLESAWVATVAANEVAARVGAACFFGNSAGQGATFVPGVAAIVASAHRQGVDEAVLANALAIFLDSPPVPTLQAVLGTGWSRATAVSTAVAQGYEALNQARSGMAGCVDTLDRRDGALARLSPLPLRAAFTGLGTAWLTRTICFKRLPGSVFGQVPLEALNEIFQRHVKAADKRLRCDQVHYLELRTSAPGFLMEQASATHPGLTPAVLAHSMARSTGALLSAHKLGTADMTPEVLASFSDRILQVASRVNLVHDWEQTVLLVDQLLNAFEPLFSGVTKAEVKAAMQHSRAIFGRLPMPETTEQLFKAIRARPDKLLSKIGTGSGRLEDARLDEWDWSFGAHIKLYSTRGGWWPERRASPDSVRATPEEIRGWLVDRFAGGDDAAREKAESLCALEGSAGTDEVLALSA